MKIHHASKHDEKIGSTDLVCQECGTEFTATDAKAENGRKYCSKECQIDASRSPQVERVCQHCGDEFTIAEYRLKDEPGKFCSRSCGASSQTGERHSRWSGGPPTAECERCGTEFEGHRGNPNRFCSPECQNTTLAKERSGENHPLWRDGLETECEMCGDEFRPDYSSNPGRFCSRDCKHAFQATEESWTWAGGQFPYGKGWNDEKKAAVRKRDSHQCQSCGLTGREHIEQYGFKLHVHHITPARQFDDSAERNAMENLVALCVACHNEWEQFAPPHPDATAE